jgi:anion-transporting  ArsA/GET3 family ATPase
VTDLPALLDRRFLLVTGKGGVGKSTVTALLAAASAAAGRRTLVCELNTQERIPGLFGRSPVGPRVTPLTDNLWSVNIEPGAALEEYAMMKLRFRTLYSLVFENPLVQRFVGMVPGMNDLLLLGKAFNHERERQVPGDLGTPLAWDCVIIDAPATGHGVTFFGLPKVILDHVPVGNMHDEARDMWELLTDARRTAVHLVTLPEELPVQETLELHRTLAGQLGLPMGALWLNQMPPAWGTPETRAAFAGLPEPDAASPLRTAWEAGRVRTLREAQAARYAQVLTSLHLPTLHLPTLYRREFDHAAVLDLLRAARAGGAA